MHLGATRRRMQLHAKRRQQRTASATPPRPSSAQSEDTPERRPGLAAASRSAPPMRRRSEVPMPPHLRQEADELAQRLAARRGAGALQREGIVPGRDRAPKIAHASRPLEKKLVASRLTEHLETQPAAELLRNKGILSRGGGRDMCHSLKGRAVALDRQVAANQIASKIETRPAQQLLHGANILDARTAPSIQVVKKQLARRMSADTVSQLLDVRPSRDELVGSGVLKDPRMCKSLTAKAHTLERRITENTVSSFLERRPSLKMLHDAGVSIGDRASASIAPALQARRLSLERQIASDNVKWSLEGRADVEDLQDANIMTYPHSVAPVVQNTAQRLDRNLRRSSLTLLLKDRPAPAAMVEMGLLGAGELHTPVTPDEYSRMKDGFIIDERTRYAVLLKAVKNLERLNVLDQRGRGALKDLVLCDDVRVMAAIEVFANDEDYDEMLDTLYRIAKHAVA